MQLNNYEKAFVFVVAACAIMGDYPAFHIAGSAIRYSHLVWAFIPYAWYKGFRLTFKEAKILASLALILFLLPLGGGSGFVFTAKPIIICLNLTLFKLAFQYFRSDEARKWVLYGGLTAFIYCLGKVGYTYYLNLFSVEMCVTHGISWRDCFRSEQALRPGFVIAFFLWQYLVWPLKKWWPVTNTILGVCLGVFAATSVSRGVVLVLLLALILTLFLHLVKFLKEYDRLLFFSVAFATSMAVYQLSGKYYDKFPKLLRPNIVAFENLGTKEVGNFSSPGGTVMHRVDLWSDMLSKLQGARVLFGEGWGRIEFGQFRELNSPHSVALELIYRTGLIGIALILFSMFLMFPWYEISDTKLVGYVVGLLIMDVVMAPVGFFHDYYWLSSPWLFAAPTLSLGMKYPNFMKGKEKPLEVASAAH